MKVTTSKEIDDARKIIAEEPAWVYDLAANAGMMFENVKHMSFFVLWVVEEMRERAK